MFADDHPLHHGGADYRILVHQLDITPDFLEDIRINDILHIHESQLGLAPFSLVEQLHAEGMGAQPLADEDNIGFQAFRKAIPRPFDGRLHSRFLRTALGNIGYVHGIHRVLAEMRNNKLPAENKSGHNGQPVLPVLHRRQGKGR
ncbi:hypothetical protein D3C75_766760 [compost metagenome]